MAPTPAEDGMEMEYLEWLAVTCLVHWLWRSQVRVVFFHLILLVIKLTSDSCVYFSKGKRLKREEAQIIYYIHC